MSIFKKLFGKARDPKTNVTRSRSGDFDGTHLIPAELWDDPKLGGFLREIGLKPDDPSNRIQTWRKEHDERIRKSEAEMNAREAAFNQSLKSQKGDNCGAIVFFLLGDACWNGEPGQFLLYHLDLSPYDDWNTVYLAADAETAKLCEIPLHPGRIAELEAWTCRLVLEIKQRLEKISGGHSSFERSLEEIKAYQAGKPSARNDVFAVANHIRNSLDKILPPSEGMSP